MSSMTVVALSPRIAVIVLKQHYCGRSIIACLVEDTHATTLVARATDKY